MTHKLSVELDPLNGRVRVTPVPEIETPADWQAFKEWLEGLEWPPTIPGSEQPFWIVGQPQGEGPKP